MLANSDVGAIVLSREPSGDRADFNRVAGIDANFRFIKSLSLNGFAARSDTPGVNDEPEVRQGLDRVGGQRQAAAGVDHERRRGLPGRPRFRPARTGVTRQFYDAAWMPQPEAARRRGIRQLQPHARVWNYYDPHGTLVTRQGHTAHAGRSGTTARTIEYAFEPREEAIASRSTSIPALSFRPAATTGISTCFSFESDHSRALSGSTRADGGRVLERHAADGADRACSTGPTYRLVFDLGLQVSDIDAARCRDASFTTHAGNFRIGYSFSTNMFLDSLLQYRTDVNQFSANVRFNFIHRPLSDFFIVYNESQFTDTDQHCRPRHHRQIHADVFVLVAAEHQQQRSAEDTEDAKTAAREEGEQPWR